MQRLIWLFLLWLLPVTSLASVSISEVAWMGSSDSANHEWIELNNTGAAVDVTDWVLSDNMNLSITLSGIVPANTRVVLERTSDSSAPGTAFLIYTGALVNSGATLRLEQGDGSLIDQVSGGENWQNIGGDNTTKETAQYSESGWVTATPTPGAPLDPLTVDTSPDDTETDTSSDSSNKSSRKKGETVVLTLPGITLTLAVDAQSIGYVNQPITFTPEAAGVGKNIINSLDYQWNFGDGSIDKSKEPSHVFKYPGTYVVTVYASYKRQEQVGRHEITILPVRVSLTTNQEGDVQINNDSPYEIDISGYRIQGDRSFVFPAYSIMLPNQTVTLPSNKLGDTSNQMVMLYDSENKNLASLIPDIIKNNSLAIASSETTAPRETIVPVVSTAPKNNYSFTPVKEEVLVQADPVLVVDSYASVTELVAGNVQDRNLPNNRFTYLMLVGGLSLGVLGIYARPKRNENDSNLVV